MQLIAAMILALGPGRRFFSARLRIERRPPMHASLLLLIQMLLFQMRAELFAVDARPRLVEAAVLAAVEVELTPVAPARGHHGMHVHVLRVTMERICDDAFRERLALVLRDHPDHLFVAQVFVERIEEPVESSFARNVAPFPDRAQQLILFKLAHVLDEVCAQFLIGSLFVGLCDEVGHVLRPEALHLALRPAETGIILDAPTRAATGRTCPRLHLKVNAHPFSASPTSPVTRATSRAARSTASDETFPPVGEQTRRAIRLRFCPALRTSKSRRSINSLSALTIISPSRKPRSIRYFDNDL
jgi:hypothetical protein